MLGRYKMEKSVSLNGKYFTIFAPPRSGSTWLFSFISYHLLKNKKFDVAYDGYFNKEHYFNVDKRTGRWSTHHSYAKNRFMFAYRLDKRGQLDVYRYSKPPTQEIRDPSYRLELLKETSSRVLLKIHPHQLDPEALEFLLQQPYVLLERKDTWQQLLSYLLSAHTKSFVITKGQDKVDVAPKSVYADLTNARRFCAMLSDFDKLKTRNAVIITYEEIFKDPLPVLTRKLGLQIKRKDLVDFQNDLDYPIKQEYGNKELYFSNIKEIRKVYERYRKPSRHRKVGAVRL